MKREYNCITKKCGCETNVYFIEKHGLAMACLYFLDIDDSGYIRELIVDESIRQQGCANELLHLCEEELKKRGFSYVRLYAPKTSWIVDWYKRYGYDIDDNSATYDFEVLMSKEL